MSEKRRPARVERRSYRSARRREQETTAFSEDTGAVEKREALQGSTTDTGRTHVQPAEHPPSTEPPSEKVRFYAAGAHVPRRSTSTIQRSKPRKEKPWARPLVIACAPVLVIILGLTVLHFALLAGAPALGTALAEEEVYERNNFPLYYRALIEQTADRYGLPASLIAAMALSESSFDADVENSGSGARGLIQLMPDTAEWVAHKLDEDAIYHFDMMLNAEDNLRYGGWYLQFLMDRFDGNVVTAVCGYHAGQGNVGNWLSDTKYSRDGKTLDVIPDSAASTGTYMKRVLSAQQIYQRRYFQAREGTPTGITLPKTPR